MYNQQFEAQIIGAQPSAEKEGSGPVGLELKLAVETKKQNFLSDLTLRGKVKGLETILKGDLPIVGHVRLDCRVPKGITLSTSSLKGIGCDIRKVEIAPVDDKGQMHVKFTVMIKELSEASIGKLCSRLNKYETFMFTVAQEELRFTEESPEPEKKKAGKPKTKK